MNTNTSTSENWQLAILAPDATIQQAIKNLDVYGLRIVMVANAAGELVGTVSDGDIRRGLLRGQDLANSLETIMHRNPLVVPQRILRETVLHLMTANKIQQIPVVDESHRVVGLHLWNEISGPSKRPNLMVIMAGGRGSRLHPYTENCPKPMLPVADRPMLEHIVERAKLEGFSRFVFAVHYLSHMIEDYFGDGSRHGVKIGYLHEQAPLGTAGALSLMERPDASFVVTNGDVLTDIRFGDLLDFHLRQQAVATMAVRIHEWQHPFGVVETRGMEITGIEEKPVARTHINAGVYALEPRALDHLERDARCDMPDLFLRLRNAVGKVIAYPMHEPWLDVGRPDDLANAQNAVTK